MKVTATSITLSIFASLSLFGCGSSSPARYYALSPMIAESQDAAQDAVVLGLGPLSMPQYLNRSQLVTRGAGAEVEVNEFNRWAEPLGPALHRVVSTDVDNLLNNVVVVAFPYDAVIRGAVDYRLLGEVSRFDADQSGTVVLDVLWAITKVGGDIVVPPHRARYETQAARGGDPAAIAAAMNDALELFSRDIAGAMTDTL